MQTTVTDDVIRVETVLKAPAEKVWAALTTPEGWTAWFSEEVQGDFQIGSILRLGFGVYGEVAAKVVERDEGVSFAYRWHPDGILAFDGDEVNSTEVRFQIAPEGQGTKLVVTETGFAGLPESLRFNALRGNESGWKSELEELAAYVEAGTNQATTDDRIVRDRLYRAPLEKVWAALATGEGLSSWFSKRYEGTFAVGELVILVFDFGGGEIEGPIKIIELEPMTTLAWKWHPGQSEGCKWTDFPESETTTVTFTFKPVEGGTHVRMVETGLDQVPASRRARAKELNREGWTEVMDMLTAYLAKP